MKAKTAEAADEPTPEAPIVAEEPKLKSMEQGPRDIYLSERGDSPLKGTPPPPPPPPTQAELIDEELKALRAENAALKAAQGATT